MTAIQIGMLIANLYIITARPCVVSHYGASWNGRLTASGTVYNCDELVCAHRTYPIGSIIRFWNEEGKWIDARIEDRGPYVAGRDFDLSTAVFDSLGVLDDGLMNLRYKIISRDIQGLHYNLDLPDESACERERLDRW